MGLSIFLLYRTTVQETLGVGPIRDRLSHSAFVADQVGSDDYASLSADSHTIQSQDDSLLLQGQETTLGYVIVNEHIALHSKVADGRAAIDGLAIPGGIADFNIRSDFAAQGSDGAVADLDILELEELSLRPLETLSPFGGEFDGFVTSTFFADVTTDLGRARMNRIRPRFSIIYT